MHDWALILQVPTPKRGILDFVEILICYLENNLKNIKSLMKFCKSSLIWDNVFKNGLSKICGGQPLKKFEVMHIASNFQRLSRFDNYHKIAVRVPKFWRTRRTWANTKKNISGTIPFT